MVRRCAVPNCESTDATITSHRFPRKLYSAILWKYSLKLDHININDLINKYVVCTNHFIKSDYRNEKSNFLNVTAIPKLHHPELPGKSYVESQDITINEEHLESLDESDSEVELLNFEVDYIDDYSPENISILINDTHVECNSRQSNISDVIEYDEQSDFNCILDRNDSNSAITNESQSQYVNIETTNSINNTYSCIFSNNENVICEPISNMCTSIEQIDENQDENLQCNLTANDENESSALVCTGAEIVDISEELIEVTDENREYINMSKCNLIEHIVNANRKITDLEAKLVTIQAAHTAMVQSLDSFKKLFIP